MAAAALRVLARAAGGASTPVPPCFTGVPAAARALAARASDAATPPPPAYPTRREGEDAAGHRRRVVNALMYRSKQRGFLELDLMLGGWADANVPHMDDAHLRLYAEVLAQENPDLFKWLTQQDTPPAHVASNPVYAAVSKAAAAFLAQQGAGASAPSGAAWVRGWDDLARRRDDEPLPGNGGGA